MRQSIGVATQLRRLLDLAIVAIVALALGAISVDRILPAVGHDVLVIHGRSMEPRIPFGSVIVLERVEPAAIKTGDVVTVGVPGGPTYTHRVAATVDRGGVAWLRTRGDANAGSDPALVEAAWVKGRVVATVPILGFILALLAMPSGMLTILSLALTLVLAARLVDELEAEERAAGVGRGGGPGPRARRAGALR